MCPIYRGEAKHSQTFNGVKGWGYMTITTTAKFNVNEIACKLIQLLRCTSSHDW